MIYRVEEEYGRGPYINHVMDSVISKEEWIEFASYSPNHPCPRSEGWRRRLGDDSFGFQSLEQLRAWFDDDLLDLLSTAGYSVSVYDAEPSWASSTQCTFLKEDEDFVGILDLDNLDCGSLNTLDAYKAKKSLGTLKDVWPT